MQPDSKNQKLLHSKLPIGEDEQILAVYKHHWFAYASIWIVAGLVILGVMGIALFLIVSQGSADSTGAVASHKSSILAGAALFSVLVGLFALVPVWLKSQEQVVLTEEALLQILQPSLFASKISQLNLQHVADVSVRQDFFGTMLGFGKISIETPGEQDNYEFFMIPDPHTAAKQIIDAHENFQAALQGGRLASTLGTPPPQVAPIDPQQYQQFLAFQQAQQTMTAQQQANPVQPAGPAPDAGQPSEQAAHNFEQPPAEPNQQPPSQYPPQQ